jgi:hypothetical protein
MRSPSGSARDDEPLPLPFAHHARLFAAIARLRRVKAMLREARLPVLGCRPDRLLSKATRASSSVSGKPLAGQRAPT